MDDDPRHVFGGEGDLLQLEEVHYFLLLVGWRRLEAHKLILPTLREKNACALRVDQKFEHRPAALLLLHKLLEFLRLCMKRMCNALAEPVVAGGLKGSPLSHG